MSVFRSEEMVSCLVYMPMEAVYSIMALLGEQMIVQFKPETKSSKEKRFVNEVQLCEDLEGKLFYLHLQIKDYNIPLKGFIDNPIAPNPRQMIDLMTPGTIDFDLMRKLYTEVKELSYNLAPLMKTVELHLEYQAILKTTCNLLYQKVTSIFDPELGHDLNVHIIGGVISRSKWNGFERALWRLYHGNYILQVSDIHDSENERGRRLFVILVHGTMLRAAINKLCLCFSADMYDIPESRLRCSEMNMHNRSILADLKKVVATTRGHYSNVLKLAAANLMRWLIEIKKMKAIYHTMNQFRLDETETFLIAECWVPKNSFDLLIESLETQCRSVNCYIKPMVVKLDQTDEKPPTYYRLNKFTKSFQNIISAYGVGNYKELNPMPYTVITFPFLFAVMFGDIGHAVILVIIALALILNENKLMLVQGKNELFSMVFTGRYIILLMGLFSIFTGFIYNDIFGSYISFGTQWKLTEAIVDNGKSHPTVELDPKEAFDNNPYPIGLDPIWNNALNSMSVKNSFKMKVSIIFGVIHMMFGHFLGLFNMLYFKDYISIFGEWVPQLIFFGGLFGYFAFLIVYKWLSFGTSFYPLRSPACAPSVIIMFVGMVLFSENKPLENCDPEFFPYQESVQNYLYFAALLCIPWILLLKPIIIIATKAPVVERNTFKKNKKPPTIATIQKSQMSQDEEEKNKELKEEDDKMKHDSEGHMDLIIHQIIHTIEFVLGTISYTASYLRLWALSLAHENLSHVLKTMVMDSVEYVSTFLPYYLGSIIVLPLGFFGWCGLTIGILVIMEGLSAFLHALRLHWMEFQNKFYMGQGYPFEPFSFKQVIRQAQNELDQ